KLWRAAIADDNRQQIAWNATVKMETAERAVKKWNSPNGSSVEVTAVLTPRLSPDGRTLVFMAAGSLYEQPANGGQAKKLIEENAYQLEPAFSPDGKRLAFVSDRQGKRELRVFDFQTRQARTLASIGGASWILFPNWTSDGKSIVYQRSDLLGVPYKFMRVA